MLGPECVVTLVHGTFAPKAQWCDAGSPLRTALSAKFGSRCLLSVFVWSGLNSHAARLKAADELRSHLTNLTHCHPNASQIVIAHSHGGNVAAYALQDQSLQEKTGGLICFATPFLRCRPRDIEATLRLIFLFLLPVSAITSAIATAVLFAISLSLIGAITAGSSISLPEEFWWGFMILYLASSGVLCAWLNKRLSSRIRSSVGPKLTERQRATIHKYDPPFLSTPSVLSVSSAMDEAGLHLRIVRLLAHIPFVLWRPNLILGLCGLIGAIVLLSVLFFALPSTVSDLAHLRIGTGLGIARIAGTLTGMLIAVIAPVLLFGVISLVAHILMLVIPKVVRSPFYGFGGETFLDNLLVDIETVNEPFAAKVEYFRGLVSRVRFDGSGPNRWVPKFRLGHCAIYDDARVVSHIIFWIGATTANASETVGEYPERTQRMRSTANPLGI